MNHFKVHKLKIFKFVLSIFAFSSLLSILPLLHQSLKPFLTMLLIDKSYMFLLCNGLVVFILKNSGLVDVKNAMEIQYPRAEKDKPEGGVSSDAKEDEEEQGNYVLVAVDVRNTMKIENNPRAEEEEEEEKEGGVYALVAIDEHDEHDDDDDAEDAEELNQRFEDFIRKTKEAFCSEPRANFNSDEFDA